MLPETVLHLLFVGVLEDAYAVLLTSVPPAFVLATVRVEIVAIPRLFICEELALVGNAITVDVDAVA